ncbi:hypothetical protein DFP72DRAFT_857351 [Ephemerocybe angulata]|uniref:Uncharacterized protein n=1 Tax=Ephemerocybe angulata TaxID=980116 RepID=A0A8H6LUP7_9AGAR|nr:hypothetical protein DFP72DRAFT_857351 [Tulosesus angulatus]
MTNGTTALPRHAIPSKPNRDRALQVGASHVIDANAARITDRRSGRTMSDENTQSKRDSMAGQRIKQTALTRGRDGSSTIRTHIHPLLFTSIGRRGHEPGRSLLGNRIPSTGVKPTTLVLYIIYALCRGPTVRAHVTIEEKGGGGQYREESPPTSKRSLNKVTGQEDPETAPTASPRIASQRKEGQIIPTGHYTSPQTDGRPPSKKSPAQHRTGSRHLKTPALGTHIEDEGTWKADIPLDGHDTWGKVAEGKSRRIHEHRTKSRALGVRRYERGTGMYQADSRRGWTKRDEDKAKDVRNIKNGRRMVDRTKTDNKNTKT